MQTNNRPSQRAHNQLRNVEIIRHYTKHAEGSVLVKFGDTHVLCTASVEDRVPSFLKGKGQGWVTAEYGMLPRSTGSRMDREAAKGKQSGRTQEIQRLIGRSLRAIIDLEKLGERSIQIDCDVIQADGGTRTASITGAYVALHDAISTLLVSGKITEKETELQQMTGNQTTSSLLEGRQTQVQEVIRNTTTTNGMMKSTIDIGGTIKLEVTAPAGTDSQTIDRAFYKLFNSDEFKNLIKNIMNEGKGLNPVTTTFGN